MTQTKSNWYTPESDGRIPARAFVLPALALDETISVAEFVAFYNDHWPEADKSHWCHEDSAVDVFDEGGRLIMPMTARIRLADCGWLVWQGPSGHPYQHGEMFRFPLFWGLYRDCAASTEVVAANIPRERLQEFRTFVESIGGKVL